MWIKQLDKPLKILKDRIKDYPSYTEFIRIRKITRKTNFKDMLIDFLFYESIIKWQGGHSFGEMVPGSMRVPPRGGCAGES